MKLLYRIVAAPLLAVTCLLAAGGFAAHAVDAIVSRFATLRDDKLSTARALAEVESSMANVNALLYRTVTVIESTDAAAVQAVRRRIEADTDHAVGRLKALEGKLDPAVATDLNAVMSDLEKYKSRALQSVTMAETSAGAAVVILSSAETSFKKSAQALHKASEAVNAEVEVLSAGVVGLAASMRTVLLLTSLAAASASLGMAWWMARRLVRDLAQAVDISEAVAAGRLDVAVPSGGPDEVGRLLGSLGNTVQRLSESLGRIQEATGSIQTASAEIAAGSQDLSTRTERTASSLQQTAGSVGLLRGTVDEGAHAAREASALAASAAAVATRGGRLVGQVVSTMQELHASSREIGTIIGTIDGIAFQTNILALNAAVEAARAGEQGRGFAVVASEVRALAQRAAEAARQIKSLVGASVDKAEAGSRLVGEAGQTMSEIVVAVERVDAMVSGIAARASEQNQGITEVNHAVDGLDQMTQQNAALVEQSAAAAESLKQQAENLAQVVGAFRFRP